MKLKTSLPMVLCVLAGSALAQVKPTEIQVTKITRNLISSPNFSFTGAEQFQPDQRDKWLEVEVEYTATADFTEEATFKYYILVGGKLLTGEVTHVNIASGKGLRSVMYVPHGGGIPHRAIRDEPPRALDHVMGNRQVGVNAVENIAVQVVQAGTVKDAFSLQRARADWFTTLPAVPNMVLNKNETPFASLYWDRYAQIKPSAR